MTEQIVSRAFQAALDRGAPADDACLGADRVSQLQTDRKFITPLARGLAVLGAFGAADEWLGNKDIAQRVELPLATTNRLLKSLALLGYLEHSEQRRKYRLAPAVLSLGYAAVAHSEIKQIVRSRLQAFADDQNLFVMLGHRDKLDIVLLENAHSSSSVLTLRLEPGARLPIAETALGWSLMSALPATERDYLLAHIEKRYEAGWPKIDRQIRDALGQIERLGYCVSPGLRRPEITAVAVPLVARDQSAVLTIGCAAATPFLGADRIHQQVGPDLVALANGLRHDLPMTDY